MTSIEISPYINEKNLSQIAKQIFPNVELQKRIDLHFGKVIVDIYFEDENGKYIFEYNGHLHYTQSETIYRDEQLKIHCDENGIQLFDFPYFVQLNDYSSRWLFGDDLVSRYIEFKFSFQNDYPHGFVDPKTTLPFDFICKGIKRFDEEFSEDSKHSYQKFPRIPQEILKSIVDRTDSKRMGCVFGDWMSFIRDREPSLHSKIV